PGHRGLRARARGAPGGVVRAHARRARRAAAARRRLSRLAARRARPHLRSAQLALRRRRHGLRGGAAHLHDHRGRAGQRAPSPARGVARARRQPLADGRAHRAAHGQPGHLLGDHDRPRPRRRRDDDRADGHRQYAGDGLEHVQRLPRPLRQHRRRAAGGARGRHALPRPLPRRVPPLLPDLRAQHRGRGGPPAAAAEVPVPLMRRLWRSGEPFIWLTGGALAAALIMVVGLLAIIVGNAAGFFWPAEVVRVTLTDGRVLTGPIADRERIPGKGETWRIKLKVANRDLYGADFVWVDEAAVVRRERPAELRARQTATMVVIADGGKHKALPLAQVLGVSFPNAMGPVAKAARYVADVWDFVSEDPRESNTEGGVFPAIFGTVMMVMI